MRGRKPEPTALKVAAGSQKCRVNREEPTPAAGRPTPPDHLDDDARAEWGRITATLERMGVLTEADGPALSIYCEAWGRKRLAETEIETHGLLTETSMGALKANPAVAIARSADATMLRVLSAYGLTASDRARVKVSAPKQNKLGEFLSKRSS